MIDAVINIILSIIVLTPNHYLNKKENKDKLRDMATAYVEADHMFNKDKLLLITMNFFESGFRPWVIGKSGEIGVSQAMDEAKELCEKKGYDLYTARGGIFCTAYLLDLSEKQCNSVGESIFSYMSGSCKINPKKMQHYKKYKKALNRLRYYKYLKKKFRYIDSLYYKYSITDISKLVCCME